MIKHVEMKDGYLILRSELAVQLYNELNISGDTWSFLSQLFNDAANEQGTSKSSEELMQVKEMMAVVLKEMQNAKAALPSPQATTEPIKVNNQIEPIDVVITEHKKPKSMVGKLGSMMSNFDKMKK